MLVAAAALTGCSSTLTEPLGTGIASYDNLRTANAACVARGGQVKPRADGDPAQLADYSCVIPGSK
jgi:hypothetical protein